MYPLFFFFISLVIKSNLEYLFSLFHHKIFVCLYLSLNFYNNLNFSHHTVHLYSSWALMIYIIYYHLHNILYRLLNYQSTFPISNTFVFIISMLRSNMYIQERIIERRHSCLKTLLTLNSSLSVLQILIFLLSSYIILVRLIILCFILVICDISHNFLKGTTPYVFVISI